MKITFDEFDAILYRKSGKYPYVSEQDDGFCDLFADFTGLKASAGSAVLSPTRCAVFVDGRYKLAAKLSLDLSRFEIHDNDISTISRWIKDNIEVGKTIAYDSRFFSENSINKIKKALTEYKFKSINLEQLLNSQPKKRKLEIHRVKRTFPDSKFAEIYDIIAKNGLDAYLLCDPCSISWLLNIRDFDSQFSNVVFGYLLIRKNYDSALYLDDLYSEIVNPSECVVQIKSEKDLVGDLAEFSRIGADEFETPSHLYRNNFVHVSNPCILQKAIKNEVEISDIKEAAKADSAAIIKLLYWLYNSEGTNSISEIQVAEKLIEFRKQNNTYVCESFPCISAADEHSAIIHYSPTTDSNSVIQNILLIDTGGQYKYGTTDITRTICLHKPTAEQKLFYTLVLKGHIAIANAKFPEGTSFAQLEPFARQFLWRHSADYPHSTSHGIGYMSCVHENLAPSANGRGAPLHSGMVISNEPGYYRDGYFGIRLENMMLVKDNLDGYLSFETLSLVPFDVRLVDRNMLTETENTWLHKYHDTICTKLAKFLPKDIMEWVRSFCFA